MLFSSMNLRSFRGANSCVKMIIQAPSHSFTV